MRSQPWLRRRPLRLVYVLVSRGWDVHAHRTVVSLAAARRVHPEARGTLLVDADTRARLDADADSRRLTELFDDIVTVEATGEDPITRHRSIKLRMRSAVDGDFLYLDSDTLAVAPFGHIARGRADLAAARDANRPLGAICEMPPQFHHLYGALAWRAPLSPYYNSGVLWVRDTAAAHRFFRAWWSTWRATCRHGVNADQPAFNAVIRAQVAQLRTLSQRDNAMVHPAPWRATDGRILHFWAHCNHDETLLDYLVAALLRDGDVDLAAIASCRRRGHPFAPHRPPRPPLRRWADRVRYYGRIYAETLRRRARDVL